MHVDVESLCSLILERASSSAFSLLDARQDDVEEER